MSEGEFHSVANDTLERLSMAFEELESEVGERVRSGGINTSS